MLKLLAITTLCQTACRYGTFSVATAGKERECDLVLRYSPKFGLGVYAGTLIAPETAFEESTAILVPKIIVNTYDESESLKDYVEVFNDSHVMLSMGYQQIYNHASVNDGFMISKHIHPEADFSDFTENSLDVVAISKWLIFPGDQIFSHYGSQWFLERNISEVETRLQPHRELLRVDDVQNDSNFSRRVPGCTTVMTKILNGQVFANVDILEGEIIEVSRAVRIPQRYLKFSESLSPFLWRAYFEEVEGEEGLVVVSGFALYLFGRGSLYSGFSRVDEDGSPCQEHNVDYAWWDISMINSYTNILAESTDCLSRSDNGNDECGKDLSRIQNCTVTMFVSFTANRHIRAGEQLFIDLYTDPSTGYRYTTGEFASPCLTENST